MNSDQIARAMKRMEGQLESGPPRYQTAGLEEHPSALAAASWRHQKWAQRRLGALERQLQTHTGTRENDASWPGQKAERTKDRPDAKGSVAQVQAQISALEAERAAIELPPPNNREAFNRATMYKRELKGRIRGLEAQLAPLVTRREAADRDRTRAADERVEHIAHLRVQICTLKAEHAAVKLPPPSEANREARGRASLRKKNLKGCILSLEAELAQLVTRADVGQECGQHADDRQYAKADAGQYQSGEHVVQSEDWMGADEALHRTDVPTLLVAAARRESDEKTAHEPDELPSATSDDLKDERIKLGEGPADAETDDATLCCVCMDAQRSHVAVPCGHQCVCGQCGASVLKRCPICPMCRVDVKCFIKVYK